MARIDVVLPILVVVLALTATAHAEQGKPSGWGARKLLQNGFQWCALDPFCVQPPSPPPAFYPPPPPPPPFNLFPITDINVTQVVNGFLQIPGAAARLFWDQATLYLPVTAEILKGSQAGANQILIDGEDRKSQDINVILNGLTNIALPFTAYTAWLAPFFTLGGLIPLGGPPGAQVPSAAPLASPTSLSSSTPATATSTFG